MTSSLLSTNSNGFGFQAQSALLASNSNSSSGSVTRTRTRIGRLGLGWGTRTLRPSVAARSATSEESVTEVSSWESLEVQFSSSNEQQESSSSSASASPVRVRVPVLTLYRDTNGWCPFCERVWVCIRAKDLPYQERLISLFDKPEWYKEMVPTTQVPAVLFHQWNKGKDKDMAKAKANEDDPTLALTGDGNANSRKLVWESVDIMKALDDAFPDTIQLVHDTPEYKAAQAQNDQLTKAGFGFLYPNRPTANTTTTATATDTDLDPEQEMEQKRKDFLSALDQLDQSLQESGGPFRLGSQFSGVDAEMVPTLERWRYQLPLKADPKMAIDITENRPFIQKWFDGMDSFQPYSERVRGDEYSWVAANAMFSKIFGGSEEDVKKGNDVASALIEGFKPDSASEFECEKRFAMEAAKKIVGNHENIVKDCTNQDPKSQLNIPRSREEDHANHVLQFVAKVLMEGEHAIERATFSSLSPALETIMMDGEQREDAALAARTVASRLCVPRDMSAPAAKILRAVLMIVSDRLSE